jgi:hypothetical protein
MNVQLFGGTNGLHSLFLDCVFLPKTLLGPERVLQRYEFSGTRWNL